MGRGYYRDGFSDVALRFMLDELDKRELALDIQAPSTIDYSAILPENAGYEIDFTDLIIEPDVFGKNHQQQRPPLSAWITLDNRELRVNENDKKSDKLPVIHHSVAERIYGVRKYRPKTIQGVKHRVVYPDGSCTEFKGLQQHQEIGMRPCIALKPGKGKELVVFAHKKYNRTGLMLQKGVEYTFEAAGGQNKKWDCKIPTR